MNKVALILPVGFRSEQKEKVRDFYQGIFFERTLKYVETVLKPEKIYILSAKYGLLQLEDEIEDDPGTLFQGKEEKQDDWVKRVAEWSERVREKLDKECDLKNDMFYFLAAKTYYEGLLDSLPNHEIIMEGLPIGPRLLWLRAHLQQGE
jgi:hypothetical protein